MGVGDVIRFAFYASRRQPRILLPAVIVWIPTIATTLAVALVFSEFSVIGFLQEMQSGSIKGVAQLAIAGLLLVLASLVTAAFLSAFYVDVTRQFSTKRKANIAAAFYVAKRMLWPMIKMQAATTLIIMAAFAPGLLVF